MISNYNELKFLDGINTIEDIYKFFKGFRYNYDISYEDWIQKGFNLEEFVETKKGICWDCMAFLKFIYNKLNIPQETYYFYIITDGVYETFHTISIPYTGEKEFKFRVIDPCIFSLDDSFTSKYLDSAFELIVSGLNEIYPYNNSLKFEVGQIKHFIYRNIDEYNIIISHIIRDLYYKMWMK